MKSEEREEVFSISFNQNLETFAVGTNQGFWIYSLVPELIKKIRHEVKGGIQTVQMVGFTNIVLLVATGENPTYPND
jgi:hypothetical protein